MSFASPFALVALLLVPLAVAAYVAFERRRRAGEDAFAAPGVRPSATPRRPGLRRHVPLVAYALAIVALVTALARPQVTLAVPAEQASIVLATDISGSMQATDVAPSRLVAARDAAESFLGEVPDEIRVGLLAFNHAPRGVTSPTTDRAVVREALARLEPSGGTATGEALAAALRQIGDKPGAVVLLSDGASTRGRDPVAMAGEARRAGVPVYTVALGTPDGTIPRPNGNGTERVPPDTATLARIAELTGGAAFTALDDAQLDAVYEQLGSEVATKEEKREVSAAFAGGGAVLLLAGAALALVWFRRLP
jgi:Ca-activated chloride channel family protein